MRQSRLYSVFVKEGRRWLRLSPLALPKSQAVKVFQDLLLGGSMRGYEMGLRVAPANDDDAKALAESCAYNMKFFMGRD